MIGLRPKIKDDGMSEARDVDLFFMGNRQAKKRMDEVDRIVRWGRIAPPFGARAPGGAWIEQDTETTLMDSWLFEPGDTWDKRSWGKTIEQGAPARVTRGGLPLPGVVPPSSNGSWTPIPLAVQPCTTGSTAQRFVSRPDGTWTHQLWSGASSCMSPSPGGGRGSTRSNRSSSRAERSSGSVAVVLAPCVHGSSSQEFTLDPTGLLKSFSSSGDCVTATNCTTLRGADNVVECLAGSPLVLMPCDPKLPGQLWTASTKNQTLVVQRTGSQGGGAPPAGCKYGAHSTLFAISPDGLQATVTKASNHAMALVAGARCGVGNGVGSRGGAAVTSLVIAEEHGASSSIAGEHEASPLSLSASFTVEALDAETFIGVVVNSAATDFDVWVNAKGSFGYGSKGLKGSAEGYSSFGRAWSVVRLDLPCAHSRIALLLSRSLRARHVTCFLPLALFMFS